MIKLIKIELKKLLKSRKNKILFLILILLLIGINIFLQNKYNNYVEKLEKETDISYNSAQLRINSATVELDRIDSEEEIIKQSLKRQYGSLEKAKEARPLILEEIDRNMKEANYAKSILVVERGLTSLQDKNKDMDNKDREYELIERLLDLKINRISNIIESDEIGLVPESALKLRNITMNDIKRRHIYYNYLADNGMYFNVNPYTKTGLLSISHFFENNTILLLFLGFLFLSMDLFLSEVDQGSYKIIYSQPYKRSWIFISKILAMIVLVTSLLLILLSINFLINTLINGPGDFRHPFVISENINRISLNNQNGEFIVISMGKNLVLSIVLFLITIFLNISFIAFLSVFTDSTAKTMGVVIALIIVSLLLTEFLPPDHLIHGLSPNSYIFTDNIMTGRYNASFILGIIVNLSLSSILLVLGSIKFVRKDFLGSKS